MRIETGYHPQPKQALLHNCSANEILYGGAAGPGKSHALRHEGFDWCMRIPRLQVYLFRRTYPELEDNHIIKSLQEFPVIIGKYRDQKKRWEFNNGSMMHFCHCKNEKDVFMYQGAEIHILLIDELTTFTEFQYDYLRARVRCTLEIQDEYKMKIPSIACATNPGGIGHGFAKERWVDFAKPMELKRSPESEGGMLRCYIPGLIEDNEILMKNDPEYIHRLEALPEPYRTAYRYGDWDIFLGQAFLFTSDHVVDPMPVPDYAQIYCTFDWGYGAPFSVGWWWVSSDGRLYRFSEWYGWNGVPNQGLRLTDSDIADGIIDREKELGISRRNIIRRAGPDIFSKKPDYRGGGQGPSTAEVFANKGVFFSPGDASRNLKIRQFRERLKVPSDGTPPMLQVYSTCEQFRRTIPMLQTDHNNIEDIDTTMEDHIYDEACHICMARPLAVDKPLKQKDVKIDPHYEIKRFFREDYIEPEDDGYVPLDDAMGI